MDIIVTKGRDRSVKQAEGSTLVRDLVGDSGHAFHGEAEAPLDMDGTLAAQGVGHGAQVLISTCRRMTASVEYNSETKTHEMPPGATLAALLAWATGPNGFGLAANQAPKHALTSCDSIAELDKTDHVGSYTTDACTACFKLVPSKRFEG